MDLKEFDYLNKAKSIYVRAGGGFIKIKAFIKKHENFEKRKSSSKIHNI